ncbi:MAG: hypothetical protein WCO08_02140 [Actinomycetes bacterium]
MKTYRKVPVGLALLAMTFLPIHSATAAGPKPSKVLKELQITVAKDTEAVRALTAKFKGVQFSVQGLQKDIATLLAKKNKTGLTKKEQSKLEALQASLPVQQRILDGIIKTNSMENSPLRIANNKLAKDLLAYQAQVKLENLVIDQSFVSKVKDTVFVAEKADSKAAYPPIGPR